MSATTGWKRTVAGSYTRGKWAVRRHPDPHAPDRPWVLYRATVDGDWEAVDRYHTKRIAQLATGTPR